MRKAAYLLFLIVGLMLLLIFMPDPTMEVAIHLDGSQLARLAAVQGVELNVEDAVFKPDGMMVTLDLTLPQSLMVGRQGHMRMQVQAVDGLGYPLLEISPAIQFVSRLEMPREWMEPAGRLTKQPLDGAPAVFHWNVTGSDVGRLTGKLWVYLLLTDSDGVAREIALLARDIEIPVKSRLGLGLQSAWQMAIGCGVMGLFLILLDFYLKNRRD